MSIPIFLINRNWLTSLQEMCKYLEKLGGLEIVIVDNNSDYPPLIEWYKTCNYLIHKLPKNAGHHSPFDYGAIPSNSDKFKLMWGSEYYLVSDCDLDLSCIPLDLLDKLKGGFEVLPEAIKVGVSLEINDVPECNREFVHAYERKYWEYYSMWEGYDFYYYNALIDTTLFMTKCTIEPAKIMHYVPPNLRTDRPYTARHLPWYFQEDTMTDEQKYYYDHADNIHNTFQWAHIRADRKQVLN